MSAPAVRSSKLLALILLATLGSTQMLAMRAPSEQVGYRACRHLLLRLLDCLIDACDIYLNNGVPSAPSSPPALKFEQVVAEGTPLLGAIGPREAKEQKEYQFWSYDGDGDGEATTKPMRPMKRTTKPDSKQRSSFPPTTTSAPEKTIADKTTIGSSTGPISSGAPLKKTAGCWQKALKWLQEQLIELRAQLSGQEKSIGLSEILVKFKQFDDYLAEVCAVSKDNKASDEGQQMIQASLEYILEVVQIMAEINDELERKEAKVLQREPTSGLALMDAASDSKLNIGGSDSRGEKLATDLIKAHYAYLTQIVTSYNLLFNFIDRDLNRA